MNYTKKIVFIITLLSAIFLIGCKTTSMQNINPIPITEGITTEEAISALINSVYANSEEKIPRGPIRYYEDGRPIRSYEDGRWVVEDATDNFVILIYSLDHHSARVKYEIKGQEIKPTVISSENLLMKKDRIHSNAIIWINRHGIAIRDAMWKIKRSKKTSS